MNPSSGVRMGLLGADAGPLLRELLRGIDVEASLCLIARTATREDSPQYQPYQLALAARFLLESEQERQGRNRALTEEELALCCDLATGVVSSQNAAFGIEVSHDAWSLAHRTAYQQLPDQDERRYVPRSLLLYRQIAPGLQGKTGFHFENAFAQRYGLTLNEYWRIGYGLYKWSLQNPGKSFGGGSLAQYSSGQGSAGRFLEMLACDYDAFRSMLDVPDGKNPHFEPYNLNPFRKLPLLRLPDDSYIAPIPAYLLRRITHGLYYDLIELNRPGYISAIGQAFNAYVGMLLEGQDNQSAYAESSVRPFNELRAGSELVEGQSHSMSSSKGRAESLLQPLSGGTDGQPWIVRDSDTAIAIKPITRPFGALSRATGDYNHLRQDLARKGGVVDCVKELQDIRTEGDNVIRLVVALEDFYFANGPFIRGIVSDEMESQGRPRMDASVQLAHVSGLEALSALSLKSGKSLCDLMMQKVDRQEYNRLELDVHARYMALGLLPGKGADLTPKPLEDTSRAYLT